MSRLRQHVLRRGFTLIELMIVVAVASVLITATLAVNFRASASWAVERERAARMQNFRFACDTISVQLRSASVNPLWTGVDLVALPRQNEMANQLWVRSYESGVALLRKYYAESDASGREHVVVEVFTETTKPSGSSATGTLVPMVAPQPVGPQPITEPLGSLAAVYFVRQGNRVLTTVVAKYGAGGTQQTASYTLETFTRSTAAR